MGLRMWRRTVKPISPCRIEPRVCGEVREAVISETCNAEIVSLFVYSTVSSHCCLDTFPQQFFPPSLFYALARLAPIGLLNYTWPFFHAQRQCGVIHLRHLAFYNVWGLQKLWLNKPSGKKGGGGVSWDAERGQFSGFFLPGSLNKGSVIPFPTLNTSSSQMKPQSLLIVKQWLQAFSTLLFWYRVLQYHKFTAA